MINFDRSDFFPLRKKFDKKELVEYIDEFIIKADLYDNFEIFDISSTNHIRKNSILFLKENFSIYEDTTNTLLVITDNDNTFDKLEVKNKLLINDYNKVTNCILNLIFIHDDSLDYSDEFDHFNGSYISKFSKIDKSSKIHKNCIIGRGVRIGKDVIIKNNVVIKNAIISDNTIISENTTIGSTGFGFDLKNMGSINIIPQIGIVYIDENVFIGANCTIDRAKIDYTFIGKNSMLDNLIHIAHNVILGNNACLAAQTGISGSVTIGDNLICGGQTGFAGHISIGNNVRIAAKSGVTKNIPDNSIIAGFPAIDIKEWKRNIINQKKNEYK